MLLNTTQHGHKIRLIIRPNSTSCCDTKTAHDSTPDTKHIRGMFIVLRDKILYRSNLRITKQKIKSHEIIYTSRGILKTHSKHNTLWPPYIMYIKIYDLKQRRPAWSFPFSRLNTIRNKDDNQIYIISFNFEHVSVKPVWCRETTYSQLF